MDSGPDHQKSIQLSDNILTVLFADIDTYTYPILLLRPVLNSTGRAASIAVEFGEK